MSCATLPLTPQTQERMMNLGRELVTPHLVGSDEDRIDALEREVAALRAELAEVRAETIGARFAHAPDYEHRPAAYQAGVE